MRNIKLLFLLISLFSLSSSYAQPINRLREQFYRDYYYHLYSSDDRVYYKDGKAWKPVYYDETRLSMDTKIKTNAPFTVVKGTKVFFCPATKKGMVLSELIKKGGRRNVIVDHTHVLHSYSGIAFFIKEKDKLDYLLIGTDEIKNIDAALKNDTNYAIRYSKTLIGNENLTNDSIINNLKFLSCAKREKWNNIFLYLSLSGNKDSDGKFHFVTSNTEYDTSNCKFSNSLPADTLNNYLDILESKGIEVYVFIDTTEPEALTQSIFNMENRCAYLIKLSHPTYAEDIIQEWKTISKSEINDNCLIHYCIIKKKKD